MSQGIANAASICNELLDYSTDVGGGASMVDARLFDDEWQDELRPYQQYLGNSSMKADIYKALHVDKSTKSVVF